MKGKDLLPIGSVVRLHDSKKAVMIVGLFPEAENGGESTETRDYLAVMYPEGFMNTNLYISFNVGDVEEVVFEGFRTPEWEEFRDRVLLIMERLEKDRERREVKPAN